MRVEVTIDKTKTLPRGAISALNVEFKKRLQRVCQGVEAIVRMAGSDSQTVMGGSTIDKETIEEILKETWESTGYWFKQ